MVHDDLDTALKKISLIADIPELSQQKNSIDDVFHLYLKNDELFRKVYSWAGSIHISLSEDGHYHWDGCYAQPRMIEAAIRDQPARRVLELCCGNGFNTIYLAKNNPQLQFEAIDLMPGYIATTKRQSRRHKNIHWQVGNVEQLDYPAGAFDLVFVVESLILVPHPAQALAEAYRVLKPGGRLVNFDYYLKRGFDELEPRQQTAVLIDQNVCALLGLMQLDAFIKAAQEAGFKVKLVKEMSHNALPDLERLNWLVGLVFTLPSLTKTILRYLPEEAVKGIIDWEILLPLFKANLMGYYRMELEKPGHE